MKLKHLTQAAWVYITSNVTRTTSTVRPAASPSTKCSDTGHCTFLLKNSRKEGKLRDFVSKLMKHL